MIKGCLSKTINSTKEFKALQNDYNLDAEHLKFLLYKYMQLPDSTEVDLESSSIKEFLNKELRIGASNIVSDRNYKIAKAAYDKFPKDTYDDKGTANTVFDKAKKLFGWEHVAMFKNQDGKYEIKIVEPVSESYVKEIQDILANAPRNAEGKLLAPNGQVSNLTERQYAQVRTKAFKEWFGDWENDPANASKAVDENGEPKVYWHGTGMKFSSFEQDFEYKRGRHVVHSPIGIFFTDTQQKAFKYKRKYTMPVFLNMRNPGRSSVIEDNKLDNREKENAILNNSEYDSAIFIRIDKEGDKHGTVPTTQWVIKDPNQVKSATYNIGTFSKEDNNIYHEDQATSSRDTRDDRLVNLYESISDKKIEREVSLTDLISLVDKNEYQVLLNLLTKQFESRLNEFEDIKVKLVRPLVSWGRAEDYRAKFQGRRAYYNASSRTIVINVDSAFTDGNASSVIMHELMHAITVDRIINNKEYRDRFDKIIDAYHKTNPARYRKALNDHYIEEFIADLWTDPDLIKELQSTKATEDVDQSLFEKIINILAKVLFQLAPSDSLFAQATNTLTELLMSSPSGKSTETFFAPRNKSQKKSIAELNAIKEDFLSKVKETSSKAPKGGMLSVSKYIYGETKDTVWKIPSTTLGNTVDLIVRDFFNGNLKENYNNLTSSQFNSLKEDLDRLEKSIKKKFGDNAIIITDELPFIGNISYINKEGKSVTEPIKGIPDMIVIDENGEFHIFDVKTSRSDIKEDKLKNYGTQVGIYRNIAETYGAKFSKNLPTGIIEFNVGYPNATEVDYSNKDSKDKNATLYIKEKHKEKFVPITEDVDYIAPHLIDNIFKETSLDDENIKEIKTLSIEDKKLLVEDIGPKVVKSSLKYKGNTNTNTGLYNPILPASERRFLAKNLMQNVATAITVLNTNPQANSAWFGDFFTKKGIDFTKMSREEIIRVADINNLLKVVYFNIFKPAYELAKGSTKEKLGLCLKYWNNLVDEGYSELILLEGVGLKRDVEVKEDIGDEQFLESLTDGQLEDKEREYWQYGINHISAVGSLSKEIRRMFERLMVLDENGNEVKDKYGYNLPEFVDSNVAVNTILSLCHNCNTMSEMQKVIESNKSNYPYFQTILDNIKEEPMRSKFFQNFRKDFTNYSIVYKDVNEFGKTVYKVHIVNTKGASKTLLDDIKTKFKTANMQSLINSKDTISGKGKVNASVVKTLRDQITTLIDNVTNDNISKGNALNELANVLSSLGIPVSVKTLQKVTAGDEKSFRYSKLNSLLKSANSILDILDSKKTEDSYNPLDQNLIRKYKEITDMVGSYIESNIESSVFENGKMYYSFVTPSYTGMLIGNLKNALGDNSKFNTFIKSEFNSRYFKEETLGGTVWKNAWLQELVNSNNAREALDHKVQLHYEKTSYKELSPLAYTQSLLAEYFYSDNYAWFRIPILSNKPSSEFIKFKKYSNLKSYKQEIKEHLKDTFNQELLRVTSVLKRMVTDVEKITNWDVNLSTLESYIGNKDGYKALLNRIKTNKVTGEDLKTIRDAARSKGGKFGSEFQFLECINDEIYNETEFGKLVLDKINNKSIDETRLHTLLTEGDSKTKAPSIIDAWMDRRFKKEVQNFKQLGLFDTTEVKDSKGSSETVYKNAELLGSTEKEIMANLENYVWNDMFATMNIIQLTVTDLAYYKNVEDFQKRFAQIHSPAMRYNEEAIDSEGNKVSDGYFRTMYIKDVKMKSSITSTIEAILNRKLEAIKNKAEKEGFKKMKDMILSAFESDFSVTDAQAYSSPTAYRKKMIMAGTWNESMQEAYNRIKEGRYDVNDLGVLWQPLKPFVYTQVFKSTGLDIPGTLSTIKVPIQNKNSEYLLFIADALTRSEGDNNKNTLRAIMDFMEETAEQTGGIKGIDTIQYNSAVKSGEMGTIDIEGLTYDEILATLRDRTKHKSSENYNEQYVHTIPVRDYGIQQNVPDHFADHYQAMGSQVRVLSISDISNNAMFKVGKDSKEISGKDLRKEYEDLIAANIKESLKELEVQLSEKGEGRNKRLEISNEKLSNLLQEAIKKDQKYGADLLRACSLDGGNFVIPLYDPIQSVRVQQLLHSIIKSRINKQKVSGGPLVQATSFGTSEDLNIVFRDKEGNSLVRGKGESIKDFKKRVDRDAVALAYMEVYMPIPSEELERDLTKEDGTMMDVEEAIKKDILTEEMLKAISYRIPTEDKYSIVPVKIKGFMPKVSGEAIMMPKEITLLTGSDFDVDKMYVMLKSFERNYNQKTKKVTYTEKTDVKNEGRAARNNRVFDIQWATLTSEETFTSMFNPGSFDVQKKTARIIRVLQLQQFVEKEKRTYSQLQKLSIKELDSIINTLSGDLGDNILFASTQVAFHQQNITTGKLIGIFANNNSAHGFLCNDNIEILSSEFTPFSLGGNKVGGGKPRTLDPIKGFDGTFVSKNIASFLAASVDAVKDPVLNFMNLNTFTAGPAMLLARLGYDSDTIGLFLSQPIIKKITLDYFNLNNDGYVSAEDIILKELNSGGKYNETATRNYLASNDLSLDMLANNISLGEAASKEQQTAVLQLFKQLCDMAYHMNTLTYITKFNSISNAAGPTIADTMVSEQRIQNFLSNSSSKTPVFSDNAYKLLSDNTTHPIIKAFYSSTVGKGSITQKIFSKYFPHYTEKVKQLIDAFDSTTKSQLNADTINQLVNEFLLYKLTFAKENGEPVIGSDYESRYDLIHNFPARWIKETAGIENDLVKAIKVKEATSKCPVTTLEMTTGYNADQQEKLKAAWSDLISNKETFELGRDLFLYSALRGGMTFSPKTPMHLMSVDTKLSLGNYIETISNINFNREVNVPDFIRQFRLNHTKNKKYVPELSSNAIVSKNLAGKNTITIVPKEGLVEIRSIIVKEGTKECILAPIITYKGKVYEATQPSFTKGSTFGIVYNEVSPLGNNNNFLEYDASGLTDVKSAIPKAKNEDTKADNLGNSNPIEDPYAVKKINSDILKSPVIQNHFKNIMGDISITEYESGKKAAVDKLLSAINAKISTLEDTDKTRVELENELNKFCSRK